MGGGGVLWEKLGLGFAEFHQPKLSSDAPVCPNSACLKYGWIHLFADPGLPIVGCFHQPFHHIHLCTQLQCLHSVHSLTSSRSCRLFFPPLRRTSRIHKHHPFIDRTYRDANFISSLALTYQLFLRLDLIALFFTCHFILAERKYEYFRDHLHG